MADRLAAPEDLTSLLQRDDIDTYKAGVLIEIATAIVQEATGGQRILQVLGDAIELTGTTDQWLDLPQIPATSVTSVTLDGTALTAGAAGSGGSTYRLRGNRLWRGDGWQTYVGEPSDVGLVYDHGYASGAQEAQLGRGVVLSICQGAYGNTRGLKAERIDDYAITYADLSAQLDASPALKQALRRQYGRRGSLLRLG